MVATFSVYFDFGGSDTNPGTKLDVDALGPPMLRFKNADDGTIDTNDKLLIPGSGTKYSYLKHIYIQCDNPDGHTIDNVAIYADAANAWDPYVDVKVGDETPVRKYNGGTPSYAGYEVSIADSEMSAQHGGITGTASLWTYTSVAPLAVSISEPDAVIDLALETCDYVVLQMEVLDTAAPLIGDLVDENGSFSYDES